MSAPAKLAAFAALLAAAFGGAWLVGGSIAPLTETPATSHSQTDHVPAAGTSGHDQR